MLFYRPNEFRGKIWVNGQGFSSLTPHGGETNIKPQLFTGNFRSTISWAKTSVAGAIQGYLNIMMKIYLI